LLAHSIVKKAGVSSPRWPGTAPFGYCREREHSRERELSPHKQFFMVLLSPHTVAEIMHRLRGTASR
jgi:hypothetical protein